VHWLQIILAVLAGLGVGSCFQGWADRRHASDEAEKQRMHASAEARATRNFEIRLDAYREASAYLERLRLWVNLTEPFMGPAPDPPDIEPDDAFAEFGGRIAVSASDDVREAMQAVMKLFVEFRVAVSEYRRSHEPGYRQEPDRNPGLEMHEARERVIEMVERAQTTMRDELALL
jgi:hypothetical protein